jgi:hypothetical protein
MGIEESKNQGFCRQDICGHSIEQMITNFLGTLHSDNLSDKPRCGEILVLMDMDGYGIYIYT